MVQNAGFTLKNRQGKRGGKARNRGDLPTLWPIFSLEQSERKEWFCKNKNNNLSF